MIRHTLRAYSLQFGRRTFIELTVYQGNYFRLSSENVLNRPDRIAQLAEHWASISKLVDPSLTVVIFLLARCGYKLTRL